MHGHIVAMLTSGVMEELSLYRNQACSTSTASICIPLAVYGKLSQPGSCLHERWIRFLNSITRSALPMSERCRSAGKTERDVFQARLQRKGQLDQCSRLGRLGRQWWKIKAAASAVGKESPDEACDWGAEIILSKMLRQQAFSNHLAGI